jgi:hypothetical protein
MIPRSLKQRTKRKDKNQPNHPQKAQFALLAKEEAAKAEGQWLVLYTSVPNFERYCRKVYLASVLRNEYRDIFTERVNVLVEFVRNVLFRAQLFVNNYLINHYDSTVVPTFIYQQNLWHSVCQLIMNAHITNESYLSNAVVLGFSIFEQYYPSIIHSVKERHLREYSGCISDACRTLATMYLNRMTENFQSRVFYFLQQKIRAIYPVSIIKRYSEVI